MKLMSKYISAATSVGRWPLFRKLRLVVIRLGVRDSGLGVHGSRLGLPAVAACRAEARSAWRAKREGGRSADHDAQAGQRSMRGIAADCSAASLIRKPSFGWDASRSGVRPWRRISSVVVGPIDAISVDDKP